MTGDKATLLQVMTADPLLDSLLEPPQIQALLEEMLATNAPMLPNFSEHHERTRL